MPKENRPPEFDPLERPIDTEILSQRVRHYLTYNQIAWGRFARLVLGVGQARLSTLLGCPRPWHQLTLRLKALYNRMEEWMDTRATYGNNPYARMPKPPQIRGRGGFRGRGRGRGRGGRGGGRPAMPRGGSRKLKSLFVYDEGLRTSEVQSAVDFLVGLDDVEPLASHSRLSADYLEEMMMASRALTDGHITGEGGDPVWNQEARVVFLDEEVQELLEPREAGHGGHYQDSEEANLTGLEFSMEEEGDGEGHHYAPPVSSRDPSVWMYDDMNRFSSVDYRAAPPPASIDPRQLYNHIRPLVASDLRGEEEEERWRRGAVDILDLTAEEVNGSLLLLLPEAISESASADGGESGVYSDFSNSYYYGRTDYVSSMGEPVVCTEATSIGMNREAAPSPIFADGHFSCITRSGNGDSSTDDRLFGQMIDWYATVVPAAENNDEPASVGMSTATRAGGGDDAAATDGSGAGPTGSWPHAEVTAMGVQQSTADGGGQQLPADPSARVNSVSSLFSLMNELGGLPPADNTSHGRMEEESSSRCAAAAVDYSSFPNTLEAFNDHHASMEGAPIGFSDTLATFHEAVGMEPGICNFSDAIAMSLSL